MDIKDVREPIAHVRAGFDDRTLDPQTLKDHLQGVSYLAGEFASEFGSKDFGVFLGHAHDLGKWAPEWQAYLRDKTGFPDGTKSSKRAGRVEHSIHGAKALANFVGGALGKALAFPVAGHHAGLADWDCVDNPAGTLKFRLNSDAFEHLPSDAIEYLKSKFSPLSPPMSFSRCGLDLSLWIRMLFSCLVDADRLDAERFDSPGKTECRSGYESLAVLGERFEKFMASKRAGSVSGPVNSMRERVHSECVEAAELPRGVFSLTVPTGGGKTLSSLSFALKHANRHGHRRVIYVIPYTSIIEQNAQVFKDVLGEDQVLEHHSNVVDEAPARNSGGNLEYADFSTSSSLVRSRLATENWDAPVIVTTTVQFFESLFSDTPSRCRKLHNIANSVVILDEAQLVPTEYLKPILETVGLLVKQYGVTLVICTATQPAFGRRDGFQGLGDLSITEMIHDVPRLFQDMKRTDIEIPPLGSSPTSWQDLANDLVTEKQVLCIVSDRKSCRNLHAMLPQDTVHLSALMCAQHRTEVIARIKESLRNGDDVRVVSTQLVEAGVDLDFPVVYRALAGLDSIVQAAGRCNREGRLPEPGRVRVFVPEKSPPSGILRKAFDASRELLRVYGNDLSSPEVFRRFFELLYGNVNSLDAKDLCKLLSPDSEGLKFRSATMKMIDNQQVAIAVPYGKGEEILNQIMGIGFADYRSLRKLQRYVVTVPSVEFEMLRSRNSLEEIADGLWALCNPLEYSETKGLLVQEIEGDVNLFVV